MIGRVYRGGKVAGLLRYLYGPGRHDESLHENPHLVAAWNHTTPEQLAGLEPEILAGEGVDALRNFGPLKTSLELATKFRPDAVNDRMVWHCALRNANADRELTDAEWGQVARDVMERTGIAPAGDPGGCRWIAVRHDAESIHLVAILARQDGRPAEPYRDFLRLREACRAAEENYGLTVTAPADRTAATHTTRQEREASARRGEAVPARDWLRTEVQLAASASRQPEEFLDRLRAAGVGVRERREPDGRLSGYAVARLDANRPEEDQVYFGGGKLAPDLSLPKLQARWAVAQIPPQPAPGDPAQASAQASAQAAGQEPAWDGEQDVQLGAAAWQEAAASTDAEAAAGASAGSSAGSSVPATGDPGTTPSGIPTQQTGQRTGQQVGRAQVQPVLLGPQEREALWERATQAAARAAETVRTQRHTDPDAAGDAAAAASEVLGAAARLLEGRRGGPLTQAAQDYDRASRETYRRRPQPTPQGSVLRAVALQMARAGVKGRRPGAAEAARVAMMIAQVEQLTVAVGRLRQAQGRLAQAKAAVAAAQKARGVSVAWEERATAAAAVEAAARAAAEQAQQAAQQAAEQRAAAAREQARRLASRGLQGPVTGAGQGGGKGSGRPVPPPAAVPPRTPHQGGGLGR